MNSASISNEQMKLILPTDRIAILGASRGLGWSVYQQLLQQQKPTQFFLSSRKIESKNDQIAPGTITCPQDFSKTPIDSHFLHQLEKFEPTRIIYMAGGGPYGEFQQKKWSDHLWALNTTFLYPAELLHHVLAHPKQWLSLEQIIFVGSDIAESKPDLNASSYAAAKHALKGLISTIQLEAEAGAHGPAVLLFSPGYMQTDMLPANSSVRLQGLAAEPTDVAIKLIAAIEKNNQR